MSCTIFAVWTVVEKDVHENQQWKPNRFWAPTISTHHLCLSKGELGFPRNPTERQIALHQSQTFSWKNTVLVMTGGRERTEMSEIWMMGGGGMCVLCGRLLVWLSGYYLFLWGVCISTIRLLSEPQATPPPPQTHLPFPGMSLPQGTLGTLASGERWHNADLLILAELYNTLGDVSDKIMVKCCEKMKLWKMFIESKWKGQAGDPLKYNVLLLKVLSPGHRVLLFIWLVSLSEKCTLNFFTGFYDNNCNSCLP